MTLPRHCLKLCSVLLVAVVAGCGGGGASGGIALLNGAVVGQDDTFSPSDGDTATGGQGQPIDGISCRPEIVTYHVHAHLSFFLNGTRLAIPDAIGIQNPRPESNGFVSSGSCLYNIHTQFIRTMPRALFTWKLQGRQASHSVRSSIFGASHFQPVT